MYQGRYWEIHDAPGVAPQQQPVTGRKAPAAGADGEVAQRAALPGEPFLSTHTAGLPPVWGFYRSPVFKKLVIIIFFFLLKIIDYTDWDFSFDEVGKKTTLFSQASLGLLDLSQGSGVIC